MFVGAANALGGAAKEDTRQSPINVETIEQANGKGKGQEHEEPTSPAVNNNNNTLLHGCGDLDADIDADMLHSVSRRRSGVGQEQGKVDPGPCRDHEEEEEYHQRPKPFVSHGNNVTGQRIRKTKKEEENREESAARRWWRRMQSAREDLSEKKQVKIGSKKRERRKEPRIVSNGTLEDGFV